MVLILAVRNFREQIFSRSFNFATDILKYFTSTYFREFREFVIFQKIRGYKFSRISRINHCLEIFTVTNYHYFGELVIFHFFLRILRTFC